MSDDRHFIKQLALITDKRISALMNEFFDEFIDNTDVEFNLEGSIHDLMIKLPEKFWTVRMHQIYGQLTGYGYVHQLLETHIEGSKPLLLGDDVYLDE